MTFLCQKLLYVAYVWIDIVVLKFISSVGQKFQRGGGGKMVLIVVEAVPAGSKAPVAVYVCISTSERNGFGASAPLSTRASSLYWESWRIDYFAEAGRIRWAVIDPCRSVISALRSICCSVLHALTNLHIWFYAFPRGETWLLSFMLQVC